MKKIKALFLFIIASLLVCACGAIETGPSTPDVPAIKTGYVVRATERKRQTQAAHTPDTPAPTRTPRPSLTFTVTLTSTITSTLPPSLTPSVTLTPALTNTPGPTATITGTPTAMPFSDYPDFTFKLMDEFIKRPNDYIGQYVKVLASYEGKESFVADLFAPHTFFLVNSTYAHSDELTYAVLEPDPNADGTVADMYTEIYIWVYGVIVKTNIAQGKISVLHTEKISPLRKPKGDDKYYTIGTEIEPGRWKSLVIPTEKHPCSYVFYDKDGNVKQRQLANGEITVPADYAEVRFFDCLQVFYVGP